MVARLPLVIVSGMPAQLPSGDTVTGTTIKEIEVDFGASAVRSKRFTITDAAVSATSKIMVMQSGKAATGRSADENEMDMLHFLATPGSGTFVLIADCLTGRVNGKYKANYLIG